MEKPENVFIKQWFNNWTLPDREYYAQELYDDYKAKRGNQYVVSLIHFGKMLRKLSAAGKLAVRSKGGKALYYNPLYAGNDDEEDELNTNSGKI
jgi:hypothetical protein